MKNILPRDVINLEDTGLWQKVFGDNIGQSSKPEETRTPANISDDNDKNKEFTSVNYIGVWAKLAVVLSQTESMDEWEYFTAETYVRYQNKFNRTSDAYRAERFFITAFYYLRQNNLIEMQFDEENDSHRKYKVTKKFIKLLKKFCQRK